MEKTYPSLKDIINQMESIDEIKTWAEQNELLHHPTVQAGMERQKYISDTVSTICHPETLTQWAIENSLLCHHKILERLEILLTCKWCQMKFV